MEKPILNLSSKHFLSGIASGAHSENGLFFRAEGITSLASPGSSESLDNGLLRGGLPSTDYTASVVVDSITCGVKDYPGATPYLYMMGDSGHFYKKALGSANPTDLRSGTPITSPSNGVSIFQPTGGTRYLYYWQQAQIGRWDLSGTYPTGWVDNQYTGLQTTTMHPTHRFYNKIFYGNKDRIGSLIDNGAGGVTHTLNVLQFPSNYLVTSISNDGIYVVIAITDNNQLTSGFADTRVIFWDGANTSSWIREYHIDEPFINSLTRVGNSVIAQGQRGLYDISFGGVKKILSRFTGRGLTSGTDLVGPSIAGSYGQSGYIFAHDGNSGLFSNISTIGKMSEDSPNARMTPIISPDSNKTFTFIETQFESGKIYAATSTPKLYSFNFGDAGSASTSVSAQTVYIPLGEKYEIERVDVIFGEPLTTGDSMSIQLKTDEDTPAYEVTPTELVSSYSSDGAIRRKQMRVNKFIADEQLSIVVNFTAGAVKIKRIKVYGKPVVT